MDIYMFLKPANSVTENDIKKKFKKSPEKISCAAETRKLKRNFFKFTRI